MSDVMGLQRTEDAFKNNGVVLSSGQINVAHENLLRIAANYNFLLHEEQGQKPSAMSRTIDRGLLKSLGRVANFAHSIASPHELFKPDDFPEKGKEVTSLWTADEAEGVFREIHSHAETWAAVQFERYTREMNSAKKAAALEPDRDKRKKILKRELNFPAGMFPTLIDDEAGKTIDFGSYRYIKSFFAAAPIIHAWLESIEESGSTTDFAPMPARQKPMHWLAIQLRDLHRALFGGELKYQTDNYADDSSKADVGAGANFLMACFEAALIRKDDGTAYARATVVSTIKKAPKTL